MHSCVRWYVSHIPGAKSPPGLQLLFQSQSPQGPIAVQEGFWLGRTRRINGSLLPYDTVGSFYSIQVI